MKRFFKNRSEKEPTPFVIDAAPSSAASSQPSLSISAGGGGGGYGSAAAAPPPAAAVSHRDGPTMVHASAAVAGQAPALNQPLSSSFGHASTPSSFESATRPHNNNMNKEKKRFLSKQQDGVTPFPLDAAAAAAAQYNNPGVATMEGAQPPPPPPPSALPAGPGVKVSRRISLRGAGERAQKAFWGGGGGGGGRDKVQHQPLAPSLPSQQQQQQDDNWTLVNPALEVTGGYPPGSVPLPAPLRLGSDANLHLTDSRSSGGSRRQQQQPPPQSGELDQRHSMRAAPPGGFEDASGGGYSRMRPSAELSRSPMRGAYVEQLHHSENEDHQDYGGGHQHHTRERERERERDPHRAKRFFGFGGGKDKDKVKDKDRDRHRQQQQQQQQQQNLPAPPFVEDASRGGRDSLDSSQYSHRQHQHQQQQQQYLQPVPHSLAPDGNMLQAVTVVEVSKKERERAIRDAQERTKQEMKREKERQKKADKVAGDRDTVTYAINSLCSRARASDLPMIINICERISSSPEEVAKEAARAVRKVLKHADTEQERVFAAKFWLLGCSNSSGFRQQAINKRFLATVDALLDPVGDVAGSLSPECYERIRDTLSHLNYCYGRDKGGEALPESWGKVKTNLEPSEGYPLASTHPVYSPQDRLLRSSGSPKPPPLPMRNDFAIPGLEEDLHKLLRETATSTEHAQVLHQALVYATPDKLASDRVIAEFYAACVKDQESLVSQMSWADAQAERSKQDRGGATDGELSLAERAFAQLLSANEELNSVLKIYHDLEREARAEQELQFAREQSKKDTKMNRNSHTFATYGDLAVPTTDHEASGPSRSRTPSPVAWQSDGEPRSLRSGGRWSDLDDMRSSVEGHRASRPRSHLSDSSADLAPPRRSENGSRTGSPTRGTRINGPRPPIRGHNGGSQQSLSASIPHSQLRNLSLEGNDDDDDEAALTQAPAKPSAKALGKRRALPREDSFDPNDISLMGAPPAPVDHSSDESSEDYPDHPTRPHAPPIKYVYDAALERAEQSRKQATTTV